jgi:hypothetical protein
MKESLADQVRQLERENERLKRRLEKEEKVRVIFKAHNGFIRYEEMRAVDLTPEILMPVSETVDWNYYKDGPWREAKIRVRTFRLEQQTNRGEGFIKTAIYREQ